MTKVSLVIPTLNAESDIEGLLNRIYRQTRRPDEVIVVDSNSSDSTVDIVKTFEWVRWSVSSALNSIMVSLVIWRLGNPLGISSAL